MIATVFEHLKNEITIEIDGPELGTSWGELVTAVLRETGTLDATGSWLFIRSDVKVKSKN